MPKKKALTPERKRELAERVAELRQALERLPPDRQDAFRDQLNGKTRKPPASASKLSDGKSNRIMPKEKEQQ